MIEHSHAASSAAAALPDAMARYVELIEALPDLAWIADEEGTIVAANGRWASYTGRSRWDREGLQWEAWIHARDRGRLAERRTDRPPVGEVFEVACRLRRHDGVYRWHLLRSAPRRDGNGSIDAWIGTATDIDDARRAEDALRLLARATARLDASLDLGETIQAAVAVAVPELADWCIVDLLADDGTIERAAVAAGDPADRELVDALRPFPTDPSRQGLGSVALRTGEPVLIERVSEEDVERIARTSRHGEVLRALAPVSLMAVPLVAHGRVLGVLLVSASRSGRRYGPGDVGLASELAGRMAVAIWNAQLYERQQEARKAAEAAADRIGRLQRLTGALTTAMTRREVVDIVLGEGLTAAAASGAVIVTLADDGETLETIGSVGIDPVVMRGWSRFPVSAQVPLAGAVRTGEGVWIGTTGTSGADPGAFEGLMGASGGRSLCAIPIRVHDRVLGALGLVFEERQPFDDESRRYVTAFADLCGQALERVALAEARESLLARLEEERHRLETVIRQMPAGVVLAEAPTGRVLLANEAVKEIWRSIDPESEDAELPSRRSGFHPDGRPYVSGEWPLFRALSGGEVVVDEEIEFRRPDGTRRWLIVSAAPIEGRDGNVVAAVATITDQTERRLRQENQRFLADASAILGASLDVGRTTARVVDAAVPWMASWCALDLVEPDGTLRRLRVAGEIGSAAVDSVLRAAAALEEPLGPAVVARTGRSQLVADTQVLPPGADEAETRQRMRLLGSGVRSFLSVPLTTSAGVAGVLTMANDASSRRFGAEDLAFGESLAARISGALERAALFRDAGRYKQLLDASLDAVFIIDPVSLRYLYVNDGAVDQLGLDRPRLLELGPLDVCVELDETRLRALLAPIIDGSLESRTVLLEHRHAAGQVIPVEVLLQRVELPGEDVRVVAIARDISERVEIQARLQRLAEAEHARARELDAVIRAIGEGLVVCDRDGRTILSNPAAHELLPDAAGRGYDAILAQLEDPAAAPRLGVRGGPVELRVRDAEERWLEISTYPVASVPGEAPRETIVLLRDATQSRQRQAIRDTFLGVLSHELRTPITTIFAASRILARPRTTLTDEQRRDVFDDVRIEAERLHRLVENVIALQRFGEDDGDVGSEPVLLQRIIPGVVQSEEGRWPGATFTVSVPPGLPTVVADPTYVEQVVRNLLSNAAKYAGDGPHVKTIVEAGDEEVAVRILDNGRGFSADEADRLFDLFYRSPATAGTAGGAGIGLFVCARLIRAMGGRIWALPRDGGGAEFGFSLRIMREE